MSNAFDNVKFTKIDRGALGIEIEGSLTFNAKAKVMDRFHQDGAIEFGKLYVKTEIQRAIYGEVMAIVPEIYEQIMNFKATTYKHNEQIEKIEGLVTQMMKAIAIPQTKETQ